MEKGLTSTIHISATHTATSISSLDRDEYFYMDGYSVQVSLRLEMSSLAKKTYVIVDDSAHVGHRTLVP